jgi:ribosomal protein S12 methylthiotransferase accessory factor
MFMIHRPADRTNLLSRFLSSARIGVIARVQERRNAAEGGAIIDFVSQAAHPDPLPPDLHDVYGGGAPVRSSARAAAIGEAVERYALSVGRDLPGHLRTIAEVPEAACTLLDLRWFLEAQYAQPGFPFFRPEATWRYDWTIGQSLLTGHPAALPAALVYLPYRAAPDERPTSFQTSVGTSCAGSQADAAYRAIMELVERDALTICWESRTPYPPVPQELVDEASGHAAQGWENPFRLRAFDLTTDLAIPVMLVLALGRHDRPAVVIGSAADLDPRRALQRAIAEAITSWCSAALITSGVQLPSEMLLVPQRDRSALIQHTLYYTRRDGLRHFAFLLDGKVPPRRFAKRAGPPPPDNSQPVAECAALLRKAACDVVLFDITPVDIVGTGLCVVRAVAPHLVRPTIGRQARHLANPRIREVPYRLRLAPEPIPVGQMLEQWHPTP